MDDLRYSRLVSAMAHALDMIDVDTEEAAEIFDDFDKFRRTFLMALSISRASTEAAKTTADALVSEARAIWGDEAARQLLAKLAARNGEGA